jgi:iron-sulfur cluster assembly accessory protein
MLYLTDSATNRIKKWLAEDGKKNVRISMKTAGCTGFMYEVVLDDNFDVTKDFAIKFDGFDLLIEHDYFYTVSGATLDYVTEGFNSHFEIVNNPNEKSKCGCGESFSV